MNRLTQFCLRGLEKMFLPDEPGFSASFRLDTGEQVRDAANEYRYSLNTLLGLHLLQQQGVALPWNLETIYSRYVRDVGRRYVNPANAGMTLWVAAELGLSVPQAVDARVEKYLADPAAWTAWEAQDFGWMLLGLTLSSRPRDLERAQQLVRFVRERLVEEKTGLFRYCADGFRRDQASFGGTTYLTYAMLRYGRAVGDKASSEVGLRAVRKLMEIQGPQWQWPWIVNVRTGTVTDWYQVYSVHQDSMAALFLTEAMDHHGCAEAREAVVRGFDWVFGRNEMARSMVCPHHYMIYRSVIRRGRLEKAARMARMLRSEFLGYRDRIVSAESLMVNPECRSYHLGWMLYVFSGRSDFSEITNHEAFVVEASGDESP